MRIKKIIFLTSVSAGLEYYDFVIYALMAHFVALNFFPNTHHWMISLSAFALFGMGYLARPLGGLVFGIAGDRFGRKKVWTSSILLMAISTGLIGIIPNYHQWGIAATIILLVLRIIQGMAYGAEIPGALTFLVEHAHDQHRGKQCSMMLVGMCGGVMLASFVSYVTTMCCTHQDLCAFGFRIPFILGSLLAIVAYFLRKNSSETPVYLKLHDHVSFLSVLKKNKKNILLGLGIALFPASFIIFGLWMPNYLHDVFGFNLSTIYWINTFGNIVACILFPVFGALSDKIGRKKLFLFVLIATIFLLVPMFYLIVHVRNLLILCFFIGCYHTLISGLASNYLILLAEVFETRMRYTGIAFCYNMVYMLVTCIPVLLNHQILFFIQKNMSVFFITLAVLTFISVCFISEKMRDQSH